MGGRGGGSSRSTVVKGKDLTVDLEKFIAQNPIISEFFELAEEKGFYWNPRNYDASHELENYMADIFANQGFNGLPTVVSAGELDNLVSSGQVEELWRGMSATSEADLKHYVNDFMSGSMFIEGSGTSYGRGIYLANSITEARAYSIGNSQGNSSRTVDRIALRSSARIAEISSRRYNAMNTFEQAQYTTSLASRGYDALRVTGASGNSRVRKAGGGTKQTYTIVYNRTALVTDGRNYY